jgi:hypothetical protein
MMIDVPIAPNHPVAPAHFSKNRMFTECRSIGKRQDRGPQFLTVALPIRWRCPAAPLLDFGSCGHAFRPLRGSVERHPFDHGPREEVRRWTRVFLAGRHAKRVVEVAYHLMGGHAPPLRRRIRIDLGYPFTATRLNTRILKRTHQGLSYVIHAIPGGPPDQGHALRRLI